MIAVRPLRDGRVSSTITLVSSLGVRFLVLRLPKQIPRHSISAHTQQLLHTSAGHAFTTLTYPIDLVPIDLVTHPLFPLSSYHTQRP